uniref:Uncharacterized protein n=1 Tax=Anguilla anguilla TaxID=7936 RepID=A0A0E9T1W2_ANGAN
MLSLVDQGTFFQCPYHSLIQKLVDNHSENRIQ